jgi:hypothetical protein
MKKLFFILLSLSLIFSNCQQNNPSPSSSSSSSSSSACGTINATVNTTALNSYNPVVNCTAANTYSIAGGAETIVLNFYSQCNSPQGAPDWNITIHFSLLNSGPIQLNTAYQWSVVNGPSAIVTTINYEAKNCGASAPQYMNITGGTTYNGTFTFTQIDTTNKLISGSCTNVTLNTISGSGPSLPFSCSFSNVPYN